MVEGKNLVANIIAHLTGVNSRHTFYDTDINFLSTFWQQKSFASKLKQMCALLLGVSITQLENEEYKNSVLWVHPNTGQDITPRYIMQQLGTEFGRNLHPNLWVNNLFNDYKKHKFNDGDSEEYKLPNWIVTDVRFPNEANAIREKGGIMIRVFRPGKLRVWFNDRPENEEDDFSGYYYLHSMEDNIYMLTEYADGKGSSVSATIDELTFDKGDSHPSETSLDHYDFDEVIINDGSVEDLIEKVKQVLIKNKIL